MALKGFGVCVVLALVVICSTGAAAQSGCTSTLISMSPCLNYINGNSSTPSSSCCSALASVVQNSPQCLCLVLNGGGSALGITVNQTQALQLPGACNVRTPPISQCNGPSTPSASGAPPAVAPTGSADTPTGSPNDVEPEAPSSDFPAGPGSKTVPSTVGSSSDGSITKTSLHILVFVLSIVACTSVITTI
ncbi:hypothetical protein Ancab_022323 [Ancistrocladus abbreviatus]